MRLVLLLMTAAAAAVYGSTAVRKLGDMPENLYAKEQKAFKHWSAHLSGYTGFSTASSSSKENTASWVCTVAPKNRNGVLRLAFYRPDVVCLRIFTSLRIRSSRP
ncbi:uncharacterized protein LOC115633955 [Scaptodrosophila lebanonensis]|uniref:Uncharacterized protein LOC115633955 n=1 Tax=Drosophila lebanonensis TaxID=7225 RepID=A0A6J2UJF1_DROLE|nr:uncharacterized protein LOC115633955 [Scaptodrosophila lebanonensis]